MKNQSILFKDKNDLIDKTTIANLGSVQRIINQANSLDQAVLPWDSYCTALAKATIDKFYENYNDYKIDRMKIIRLIARNEKMERVNKNSNKKEGIFLKLFIYDLEKYLQIELTKELMKMYPNEEFSKTFLRETREKMPKKIKVKLVNNAWIIVDYDLLFEKLK